MRVTIVRYARLKNLGNYENERVELEAELHDGDEPGQALDDLRVEADMVLFPPPPSDVPFHDDDPPF